MRLTIEIWGEVNHAGSRMTMESGCDLHLKQYKGPKQQPKTQMNRKIVKQPIAFVSNSKNSVMRRIRCSGRDSMFFVAVAAGPKIGALAIEASQPVDSETAKTSEIRDQAALKRGRW
jgi:hypothetical protein